MEQPVLMSATDSKCPELTQGEAGTGGADPSAEEELMPAGPMVELEDTAKEQSPQGTADSEGAADKGSAAVRSHLGETAPPAPGPGGDASPLQREMETRRTKSIDAMLAEISSGLKMECVQWTQVFRESEQFEICSSSHVEKLLEEAKTLEQNMLQQKERLLSHLKLLSQTLKLP